MLWSCSRVHELQRLSLIVLVLLQDPGCREASAIVEGNAIKIVLDDRRSFKFTLFCCAQRCRRHGRACRRRCWCCLSRALLRSPLDLLLPLRWSGWLVVLRDELLGDEDDDEGKS